MVKICNYNRYQQNKNCNKLGSLKKKKTTNKKQMVYFSLEKQSPLQRNMISLEMVKIIIYFYFRLKQVEKLKNSRYR